MELHACARAPPRPRELFAALAERPFLLQRQAGDTAFFRRLIALLVSDRGGV